VNRFVGGTIDEHRARNDLRSDPPAVMDFTDVLLSLQGDDKLSDADMIAVLWVRTSHVAPTLLALNSSSQEKERSRR